VAAGRGGTAEGHHRGREKVLLYDDGTWRSADQLAIDIDPRPLPAPSWQEQLAPTKEKAWLPTLRRLSAKRNKITDDDAWFDRHGLSRHAYEVPNALRGKKGDCPPSAPSSYKKHRLVSAFYDATHLFLVYGKDFSSGRYLLITTPEARKALYFFDFRSYIAGPPGAPARPWAPGAQAVTWAAIEGGVLYVSHRHRTYASTSGGKNAYVSAISLDDGRLLWRSRPLTCNAASFSVVDDAIICGYGFTKEPDSLYVLNKLSGAVAKRIKLKSGPDYIIARGDRLYVRTYDTDYVFSIGRRKPVPLPD
jgi:hypothetical protein